METSKTNHLVSGKALDDNSEKIFKRRRLKDVWAKYSIATGGLMVIVAVLLIFVYLLAIVLPLFSSPDVKETSANMRLENASQVLYHGIGEYGETTFFIHADGKVSTYRIDEDYGHQAAESFSLIDDARLISINTVSLVTNTLAALDDKGRIHVFDVKYRLDYSTGKRVVYPEVIEKFADAGMVFTQALPNINKNTPYAFTVDENRATLALVAGDKIYIKRYSVIESMLDDELRLELDAEFVSPFGSSVFKVFLSENGSLLYSVDNSGKVALVRVTNQSVEELNSVTIEDGAKITTASMLLGRFSILVGDSQGRIHQLFPARDADNNLLIHPVRLFEFLDKPIVEIVSESRRKGFLVVDEERNVGVFFSTSGRQLYTMESTEAESVSINSRNNRILYQKTDGSFGIYYQENEHPEVSFSSLWQKVWYEGYNNPEFIWQSSASTNDFEPKFSLTPLTFGTLKAAFYAMLFSVPLAIAGAIYTAYFMRPSMRKAVKPAVEIMEALPTVILGFLAGLWLAPFVEENLAGIFTLLISMPIAIISFGLLWHHLPMSYRNWVMSGWHAAILIPMIILVAILSIKLGVIIEQVFFDGNVRQWITADLGITYDQRNALVVGLAMGFAVIPTIFSITEDALFSVPKHLSNGSLALGATPWQTVTRVVLPTASPGMFSAIMIGFGRAVGETMIVLMATGNTAVMELNIFEGMRTLSANIAVEMPESEVGSTHFRVLFLAAFVLFLFTFVFNTGAEVIRQRLRKKYGSL